MYIDICSTFYGPPFLCLPPPPDSRPPPDKSVRGNHHRVEFILIFTESVKYNLIKLV